MAEENLGAEERRANKAAIALRLMIRQLPVFQALIAQNFSGIVRNVLHSCCPFLFKPASIRSREVIDDLRIELRRA